MKIAFVILNYKNFEDTLLCVESIQKLKLNQYIIVIVDNGSNDDSIKVFHEKYDGFKQIKILQSDDNIGFSKGNNLGYTYVRNNYDADFLVVTNNDVLFPQDNFAEMIEEIYSKTNFMVLGPDIYVRKTMEHQSPITLEPPTIDGIEKELKMYEYYYSHPQKWVRRRKFQNMKNILCYKCSLFNKGYKKLKNVKKIDRTMSYSECCVQGACIIVSKDYIKLEKKMFEPEPFLYCEELFLYIKCLNKKYKIVYDPKIIVFHEDSSTIKKINRKFIRESKIYITTSY